MSLDLILRTTLTGGTDGALDNYPVADCETGKPAIAFVVGTGFVPYIYDETEAGAESSPDIIIPDDNASGTGAWKPQKLFASDLDATDLTLSGGLYLGGSAAANYLDDYEEGTYTVTCTPATSGSVTLDSTIDLLAYTKFGRKVTIQGYVQVDSVSSPSGILEFSVPFAISNMPEYIEYFSGSVTYKHVVLDTGYTGMTVSRGSYTSFVLWQVGDNIAFEQYGDATENLTGDEDFIFSFSYITL